MVKIVILDNVFYQGDYLRILIVDDEVAVLIGYTRVISKHGIEVTTTDDIDAAINEINNSKYDVLITDMRLDNDDDGFKIAQYCRSVSPQTFIILVTGSAPQKGDYSCFNTVMEKPVTGGEIIEAINSHAVFDLCP